jgi:hypothetical protein
VGTVRRRRHLAGCLTNTDSESTPHIVGQLISGDTSIRVGVDAIHWNGHSPVERLVEELTVCTR